MIELKKIVLSAIVLLLLSTAGVLRFIRPAVAEETIYIKADGSVEGTDKIKRDGNVYTFTDNIYNEIVVEKDNIVVDGTSYTLEGTRVQDSKGIYLSEISNVTIRNINIKAFWYGILLENSSNNRIHGNELTNNSYYSIKLYESTNNSIHRNEVTDSCSGVWFDAFSNHNSISENNITNNEDDAICLLGYGLRFISTSYNVISGNNITNNGCGIRLVYSSNTAISGNNVTNNWESIRLYRSSSNSISGNKVTNSTNIGIYLGRSSNNNVQRNEVTNSYSGILLASSSNYNRISENNVTNNQNGIGLTYSSICNSISGNNITNNAEGVSLAGSSNNSIYHNNFINNTNQVYDHSWTDSVYLPSMNTWDKGYPSGGNYWSDYADVDLSSGPYQNETGSDGIGDTPYIIDENNRDRYPLMYPWSPLPVHNINTGLGYATIQEAINSNETLDGHTIFVEEGIYCENLVVNKSLSLNGENRDNTVIDGNFTGTVINIESDNANITGFTIQNSGYGYGVYVELSDGNNISHNIITNNYGGIALENSLRNNIYGNNITANNVSGVFLGDSSNNAISGNDITANYDYGIRLDDSSNNTISGNKITNNGSGIWLGYSSIHNSVSGNDITANNLDGVTLSNSNYNSIFGNNITANQRDGVGLYLSSSFNSICRNNITNNQYGIELYGSSNHNIIYENNIANNYRSIWLFESSFTSVYHNNFVNNTKRVAILDSVLNVWDKGYPSGGNYWSDHIDVDLNSGSYQNVTGSDGIWDHPYIINEDNRDNYPLTEPWTAIATITILSPQNKTYTGASIPLTFTVNRATSWIGYSLNGQENVTISGNTTLTSVSDGSHSIVVYANGASGITGVSSTVYFTVDATAPDITSVSQTPLSNNVLPEDEVKVNATVSDNISGVKHATLVYAYTNSSGTWIRTIAMANLEGSVWNATIPAFPYGTNVTYIIIAEDNLGNQKTTEEMGYEYKYQVILEFPTWTLMLFILIVLTISIAIDERRPPRTPIH